MESQVWGKPSIQKVQIAPQGGFQAALNERTAIALEMFGSERNRGRCAQDPDRQKAGAWMSSSGVFVQK